MIVKQRESNLELLRIIAMMLVLMIHYVPSRETIYVVGGGYNDMINSVINFSLKSLCIVCVNCFVLISGYFGIKFKIRSFANLLFQLIFWSLVCIAIVSLPIFPTTPNGTLLWEGIKWGWFPRSYMILFVLSPLLNAFCQSCSPTQLGRYTLVYYLLSIICGYFLLWPDFNEGMSVLSLIGLYLLGAYLRKTNLPIFNLGAKYNLAIYFIGGISLVLLSLLLKRFGVKVSPYGYLNPVVVLMSVFFFLSFVKINLGHKRWINFIAASAFSIYLFHYNPLIFPYVREMWQNINIHFGMYVSLLAALVSFVMIYMFCLIIDRVRIFLFDCISGLFNKA